jgi:TRAP-type C4-dicarboxylate transport system permease small subunit
MAAFMVICIYGLTINIKAARGVTSLSVSWFMMNYLYAIVFAGCILMIFASVVRALEYAILNKELPPPQGT